MLPQYLHDLMVVGVETGAGYKHLMHQQEAQKSSLIPVECLTVQCVAYKHFIEYVEGCRNGSVKSHKKYVYGGLGCRHTRTKQVTPPPSLLYVTSFFSLHSEVSGNSVVQ